MHATRNRAIMICAALTFLVSIDALGQTQSVNPGINDNFVDPDVNFYINLFEGEDRTIFKHRNEIIETLDLEPGMDVADVGAGTGFFSRMMAYKVAPGGTVFAVDIAENFVEHIEALAQKEEIPNLRPKVCSDRSIELPPNTIDLAFICDTYHHFEYPFDTMSSIHKALRPGGRVVIVDFERVKGISSDWVLNHVRCGKGTVADGVKDSGFDLIREVDLGMDGQYILIFQKREPTAVD